MVQARSKSDPKDDFSTALDQSTTSGAWTKVAGHPSDPETPSDTGIVRTTLLVSDLVGSTRLFEKLGDERAAELLRLHDRRARDLLAVHGGREIDKTDGFLMLFERPVTAIVYAQAYHQMLEELSELRGVEVTARVGIHVGRVILYENTLEDVARGAKTLEVEGLAKPMASRLMSLALGRQTLVSRKVYDGARHGLREGTEGLVWMNHGTYRFKGVEESVEVFEVGRQGFSPLTAPVDCDKAHLDPPRGVTDPETLPHFGRKPWRIAAVMVVCILALALAHWLTSVFSPSARERPSIAVLGFKNSSGQTSLDWISTAFSEMLRTELEAGEKLRIVPGESVSRVKIELELPDVDALATDTLARLGRNLGTDFVVLGTYFAAGSGENRSIRLDFRLQDTDTGETLASHSQMGRELELSTMAADVGTFLRGKLGIKSISDAQAEAIRATVSSNPAAMRAYSEGLEHMRRYDALAARELLTRAIEADPRYALAHAALSEAWSALGYDEEAAASAQQALELALDLPHQERRLIYGRYYEASSQKDKAVEIYRDLWRDYPDNIEYGLLLAEAERLADNGQAALRTVEKLHRLPEPWNSDPRIDLAEAFVAHTLSDYQREVEASSRAAAKGREREARTLVAEALLRQGTALNFQGKFDEAEAALEESRKLFEQVGDLGKAGAVLNIYGQQLEEQGLFTRAEELLEKALAVHRQTGNRKYVSIVLASIALLKEQRGDLATAWKMLEESLAAAREIGDRRREAHRQILMSSVLLRQGSLVAAQQWLQAGLKASESVERRLLEATGLRQTGRYSFAVGRLEEARHGFEQALELYSDLGFRNAVWQTADELGEVLLAQGDLEGARARLELAETVRSEIGGPLARVALGQACLALVEKRFDRAETLTRNALAELEREKRLDEANRAAGLLVRALVAREELAAAAEVVERFEPQAENSQSPQVRLSFAVSAAVYEAAAGDGHAARERLALVQGEAARLGLVGLELEARLASGRMALASGKSSAEEELRALATEAKQMGFNLLAQQALDV